MDALEMKLYSDVAGLDDGDVKDLDKVFGAGDFDLDNSSANSTVEEGDSTSSSSGDLRNAVEGNDEKEESVEIKIGEILNNPEKARQMQEKKIQSSTRTGIIDEIERYKALLKERNITIPDNIAKIISKPSSRRSRELIEARDLLKRNFNNSETSETITELQMTAIGLLTAVFNGKNKVPFTNFKLNLTGYPQQLRRKMKQITNQNMRVAGVINDRIGDDVLEVVKYFALYISPLIAVIMVNHGPSHINDADNYKSFDDEEEEEDEEETEESEEETEESDSD